MDFSRYTIEEIESVTHQFQVSLEKGLTSQQAEDRLKEWGFNDLGVQSISWVQILWRQFRSPFVYLLIVAAVLAGLFGEHLDAVMITLFILINAGLGFFQEYRSEQTVKLLQGFVVKKAKVRRNGVEQIINVREIVPGDVVIVETGDVIPADIRFVKCHDLLVNESILTGETVEIQKKHDPLSVATVQPYEALNLGFMGTTVVSGKGEGVVIGTGAQTQMGSISALTAETAVESSFEKGISKFSAFILQLIVGTLAIVFVTHALFKPGQTSWTELLIFSIALAVGVIPEALPLVTTFSLSRGALRLAKQKVVIKRLSSVEELGSIQILCSDKTGTLTENKLSAVEIWGDDKERVLEYAALAGSEAIDEQTANNAFDVAVWDQIDSTLRSKIKNTERITEIPFDPQRRRNSVLLQRHTHRFLVVRGAVESLLPNVKRLPESKELDLYHWVEQQGQLGRRVLAIASQEAFRKMEYVAEDEIKTGLLLVGLIAFEDPVKKSTADAVRKAKRLGVTIKILTGDAPDVAAAVGKIVDIGDAVITGEQLEKLSSHEQHKALETYNVFARVSPEQKYRIIKLLQEKYIVGYLGEGINDAPALKAAQVGLVVEGASDIAQEAADIVLLKSNLEVIVNGIEEGRQTFMNTVKYIKATLASNFGNFYAVAFASLIIDFLPMLPIQILLVNLLSDFPMIAIATDTVDEDELQNPKTYDVKEITLIATVLGLVSTTFDFMFFAIFFQESPEILRTSWFIGSILTELLFIYSIRTRKVFWQAKRPSNAVLLLTIPAAVITVLLPYWSVTADWFGFVRLEASHLLIIGGVTLAYFLSTEIAKRLYNGLIHGQE